MARMLRPAVVAVVIAVLATGSAGPSPWTVEACAQSRDPMAPPQPPPKPLPNPSQRSEDEDDDWQGDRTPDGPVPRRFLDDGFLPEFDGEWGLPDELLAELGRMSAIYEARAAGFTAIETARSAKYQDQEAGKENVRRYAYILKTSTARTGVDEVRNELNKRGQIGSEVADAERFPPAYAWIYLFHAFNQPYFSYRLLGDRLDGFDWVREIQFRGALPFAEGRDIREWEGVILVDVVTNTPVEIRAQPSSQVERMRQMFQNWSKSFNLAGYRTGPKPFGFRCEIECRERRSGLTYPSRLRYDTFRAIRPGRAVPWAASSRFYTDYRLFGVTTEETVADAPGSR